MPKTKAQTGTAADSNENDARTKRLTNEEFLAELYEIRDRSVGQWKHELDGGNAKLIVALATSLEKAMSCIKQAEGIAMAKEMNGNTGEVRITIAGLDPSAFEFAPPLTQGDEQ